MRASGRRTLVAAGTIAAVLGFGQASAFGAEITVDVLTDTGGTAAECQLRDAIATANTGVVVDGCEAGTNNGSDNIFFSVTGMITLTGGPLIIDADEPVQFFGPEDEINLTISGGSTQGIINAAAPIRLDGIGLTAAQTRWQRRGNLLHELGRDVQRVHGQPAHHRRQRGLCVRGVRVGDPIDPVPQRRRRQRRLSQHHGRRQHRQLQLHGQRGRDRRRRRDRKPRRHAHRHGVDLRRHDPFRRERLRLGRSDLHGVDRGHQGLDVPGQQGRGFPRPRRRDLQPSRESAARSPTRPSSATSPT